MVYDRPKDNTRRIEELEKKVIHIKQLQRTVTALDHRILNAEELLEPLIPNLELISETVLGLKARLDKLDRLENLMLDLESRIAHLEKNLNLAFETINNHEGS